MDQFTAKINIIGINPFVLVPLEIRKEIFRQAGKDKGHIPVRGTIDGHPFVQTLVKYSGKWRLYLNTPMRNAAGKDVGDTVTVALAYDERKRVTTMHPALKKALKENEAANDAYHQLPPYMQKEIKRYINALKTPAAIEKNVKKAMGFLIQGTPFIGRGRSK